MAAQSFLQVISISSSSATFLSFISVRRRLKKTGKKTPPLRIHPHFTSEKTKRRMDSCNNRYAMGGVVGAVDRVSCGWQTALLRRNGNPMSDSFLFPSFAFGEGHIREAGEGNMRLMQRF
jgi:hypothetical protein